MTSKPKKRVKKEIVSFMSQSVVMAIDPQPELLWALQEDLQRSSQKFESLYANSPLETLKKLKDSRSHSNTLTLLIV
jgi:hypothetical protein